MYLFFPGANVLHTGDLFFGGIYPVIDYSTGCWIGGMVAALDAMMKVGSYKEARRGRRPAGQRPAPRASSFCSYIAASARSIISAAVSPGSHEAIPTDAFTLTFRSSPLTFTV